MRVARMFPVSCGAPFSRAADFESLFRSAFSESTTQPSGWSAPVAIWSDAEHSYVEIELPGVSQEDLDIQVENGQLTVSAERRAPEGERQYAYNARRFGKYTRAFKLPEEIDAESISAELKEGVLKLALKRRPETQPRKIKVQGS